MNMSHWLYMLHDLNYNYFKNIHDPDIIGESTTNSLRMRKEHRVPSGAQTQVGLDATHVLSQPCKSPVLLNYDY
jgi:hypothetical protein